MKKDAVIFDIDGTLTNSIRPIIASWNRHLSSLEYPYVALDEDLAASLMGKTMDDWAKAVLPSVDLSVSRGITETMERLKEGNSSKYARWGWFSLVISPSIFTTKW